jgi:PBP1b-binding outer membrane lipoprotein LpoB
MKKIALLTVLAVFLTGCEKVYDSTYYQANCKKAEQVLERCKSGDASGDNCKNASEGMDKFKSQAFEDYMMGKTKTKPSDACQ